MKTRCIILALSLLSTLFSCGEDDRHKIIDTSVETVTSSVTAPASSKSRYVLYEANPKCFAASGALKAIEARLDEIKALGTDILWVMPIHPIGAKNSVGSPYCIKDYRAVNPSYGTLDDMKSLVKSAHAKGMKVMMDWVPNHTAWDNAWVTEHPDWYTHDASGNIISPAGTGWNDVADLNYDNAALRSEMTECMKYWIEECDVDGFRCDYAHGVPDSFWKEAIPALRSAKKDIVMLAESDYDRLFACGFDIIFCRAFKSSLIKLFNGKMKPSDFMKSGYLDNISSVPASATKLFFITNHDDASENSPVVQFPDEGAALAAFVLASALDCSSLIYSSQEIGYTQKVNFFNNTLMGWDSNRHYTDLYKGAMQSLKKISRSGAMSSFVSDHVIFVVYPDGAVAVNVSGQEVKVKVPAASGLPGESLSLGAYEFAIREK